MSEGAPRTDKSQYSFLFFFFLTPIMEASEAVLMGYSHGLEVYDACLE